jgi:hypothetical protein
LRKAGAALKQQGNIKVQTTMGLTSGTGEPVMRILIFDAAEMDVLTRLGFDHQAEIPYDKDKTLEENMGPAGKALPGAPTCTFRGKEVPALVAMTKKGSMTSEILAIRCLIVWMDLVCTHTQREGPFLFASSTLMIAGSKCLFLRR